jgi:cytidine deaminase
MDKESTLIAAALEARGRARVPYSGFAVGAAVQTRGGLIFKGCNIENISLRLTLCAEEVAIGAAIAAGETDFTGVAVVAESKQPIVPCGGCRQLMAEFNPAMEVISATLDGRTERYSLKELLPRHNQGILEKAHDQG